MKLFLARSLVGNKAIIRLEEDNCHPIVLHGQDFNGLEGAVGVEFPYSELLRMARWISDAIQPVQDKLGSAE